VPSRANPKVDTTGPDSDETTGRDTTFPLAWERSTAMESETAMTADSDHHLAFLVGQSVDSFAMTRKD